MRGRQLLSLTSLLAGRFRRLQTSQLLSTEMWALLGEGAGWRDAGGGLANLSFLPFLQRRSS